MKPDITGVIYSPRLTKAKVLVAKESIETSSAMPVNPA